MNRGGGGYVLPVDPTELPGLSELAVVITVVDVQPSKPNTASGLVPPILEGQTEADLLNLGPITPVEVQVEELVGSRGDKGAGLEPGSTMTIEVAGGVLELLLSARQVASLGIAIPAEDIPDDGTGVVPYFISVATDVDLTEGDRALVWLITHGVAAVDDEDLRVEAGVIEILTIAHGRYGIFPLADFDALPDDLRSLGESLNET